MNSIFNFIIVIYQSLLKIELRHLLDYSYFLLNCKNRERPDELENLAICLWIWCNTYLLFKMGESNCTTQKSLVAQVHKQFHQLTWTERAKLWPSFMGSAKKCLSTNFVRTKPKQSLSTLELFWRWTEMIDEWLVPYYQRSNTKTWKKCMVHL